jgi:hypothetical protein
LRGVVELQLVLDRMLNDSVRHDVFRVEHLMCADVIIGGRSSFVKIAGYYNECAVLNAPLNVCRIFGKQRTVRLGMRA